MVFLSGLTGGTSWLTPIKISWLQQLIAFSQLIKQTESLYGPPFSFLFNITFLLKILIQYNQPVIIWQQTIDRCHDVTPFPCCTTSADSFCLKISGERVIYNPLYFSPICGFLRHSRGIIYSTCKVAGVILLSFHRCCVKFVKHSEMFQIRRWSWLTQLEGDMLSLRYFSRRCFG